MSFVPSTGALVPVTEAYIKTSMRICSPEILEKRLRKLKVVTSCYCPSLEKKTQFHKFIQIINVNATYNINNSYKKTIYI